MSSLTSTNRAKPLSDEQVAHVLKHVEATSQDPLRDYVIILLSFKAGLRACEIAGLRPLDLTDAGGKLVNTIRIPANAAKNGRAREVPMHPTLKLALAHYLTSRTLAPRENLIRGLPSFANPVGAPYVSPNAVAQYLRRLYITCGLVGVSSHSGRRTFLTRAAQLAGAHGCSLRDVQLLAGHASISTTEVYVEPSERQAELVGRL